MTSSGLDVNAKVKIGGVDVGFVKQKSLEANKPKITMVVFSTVYIPIDSTVNLAQDSLLGTKFVEIRPGKQKSYLTEGGVLLKEEKFASFDETATSINSAANELKMFIAELRGTFNTDSRENIQDTIKNFNEMAKNVAMQVAAISPKYTRKTWKK